MKKLFLLLALASWPSHAQNFSGVWALNGDVDDDTVSPTCTLTQTGQSIFGSCKIDAKHTVDVKGVVKGKQITWTYSVDYGGATYKLTFSGLIGEDKLMQGTIAVDPSGASGEFTAERK